MAVRYQDVFVPGGFPKLTYNPRLDLRLENQLEEAKNNLCKLVTVTGQTKSGKTVLAKSIFTPEESVWIEGGMVTCEDDFWETVLDQLNLFGETEEEVSSESSNKSTSKITGDANLLIASTEIEHGRERESKKGKSITKGRSVSPGVAAASGLRKLMIPVVVDDFHYIDKEIQGRLARALKPLIFDGLPVTIIAIPHRRYDAVKVEREMTGRIAPVNIPSWTLGELNYIATSGFSQLNLQMASEIIHEMSRQSIGSPHLMQEFCKGLCKSQNLAFVEKSYSPPIQDEAVENVFREAAESIGRPIFEKLARGPRQRTDRRPRQLKDGKTVDIYQLVLQAMAYLKPELISIEYEELRTAIKEVSASQAPQLHEVARVLKHMSTIAATDQSSTAVIEFTEDEKLLHVTDPFFAFYLRWGDMSAKA